jgi:glycosyltransferase involved in cell wall biosynthesis
VKKIVYWSPVISKIATFNAVINSAKTLKTYSNDYEVSIINTTGEYDELKNNNFNIKIVDFFKIKKKYCGSGFFKTRISLFEIFFKNFFKLKRFLDRDKPDFLIIHLLTSLPLILLILFKFKTKFILRISGYPKMNFLRNLLWKIALKKIYCVISPTEKTSQYLISLNLIKKDKILSIYDPIISYKKIHKLKKEEVEFDNYFVSIGRLTKQKNLFLLLKTFNDLYQEKKLEEKLIIIGDGELKIKIQEYINSNNLNKKILLLGYKKNVYKYLYNAKAFILTSLWEDPGFVLIEAANCRTSLISSDCKNGPIEFLQGKNNGYLFKSNSQSDLKQKILEYKNSNVSIINKKKLNALKESCKFSFIRHFINLNKLLNY